MSMNEVPIAFTTNLMVTKAISHHLTQGKLIPPDTFEHPANTVSTNENHDLQYADQEH